MKRIDHLSSREGIKLQSETEEESLVDFCPDTAASRLFPNVQVHFLHYANTTMGSSDDFTFVAESVRQACLTNMQEVCPGPPDNSSRRSGQVRYRGVYRTRLLQQAKATNLDVLLQVFTPAAAALFVATGVGLFYYFQYEKQKLQEKKGPSPFTNRAPHP